MRAPPRRRSLSGSGLPSMAQPDSQPASTHRRSHSGGSTLGSRYCCSRSSRSSRGLRRACRPLPRTLGCRPSLREQIGPWHGSTTTPTAAVGTRPTPHARPSPMKQTASHATCSSSCSATLCRIRRRWPKLSQAFRASSPRLAWRSRRHRMMPTTRRKTRATRKQLLLTSRCRTRRRSPPSWCSRAIDPSTCCLRSDRLPPRTTALWR